MIQRYNIPDVTAIQEKSAVRCPLTLENYHILLRGQCENTFKNMYLPTQTRHDKVMKIFSKRTTLLGIEWQISL